MIISEKQIMALIRLLEKAIKDDLSDSKKGAIFLIDEIYNQQSNKLKVIE